MAFPNLSVVFLLFYLNLFFDIVSLVWATIELMIAVEVFGFVLGFLKVREDTKDDLISLFERGSDFFEGVHIEGFNFFEV